MRLFRFFCLFLSLGGLFSEAQSLFTRAQRSHTPQAAQAIILSSQSLPGNVVNTLIAGVSHWPKQNIQEISKRSSVKIPEKYVLFMTEKYGSVSKNGEITKETLFLSEILDWSKNWDRPSQEVIHAWLKHHPIKNMERAQFIKQWTDQGGLPFLSEILP